MTPLNLSMKSFGAKSFEVSQYLVKNGADMTEEERWIIAQVEQIRADVNAQDTEYDTQPYAHAHGHSLMLFVLFIQWLTDPFGVFSDESGRKRGRDGEFS
jgi:hypothetical protein